MTLLTPAAETLGGVSRISASDSLAPVMRLELNSARQGHDPFLVHPFSACLNYQHLVNPALVYQLLAEAV